MISLKATLEAIKNSISTLKMEVDGKQDKAIAGSNYIVIGDVGICWGSTGTDRNPTLPLHFADGAQVTVSNSWYNTYKFYILVSIKDGGSYSYLSSTCSSSNVEIFKYIVIGKLK